MRLALHMVRIRSNIQKSLTELTVEKVVNSSSESHAEYPQPRTNHLSGDRPGDCTGEPVVEKTEHQRESDERLAGTVRVSSNA